jgi:Na+-driven multidrug efflux pump
LLHVRSHYYDTRHQLIDSNSIYTVVLSNRLASTIPAYVPPALASAGLPTSSIASFISALTLGTSAAWSAVEGLTPEIQAVGVRAYQDANAAAYKTVFLSTIAFCGVGIVLCFFAPNIDHLLGRDVVVQLRQKGDVEMKEGNAEKV